MTNSGAFTSIEQAKTGSTVYVTTDLAVLKKQWEEAELGAVDDDLLESYLGCVAKIVEVEEDDDTVNLEWATKDTQWIPIMACVGDLPTDMRRHAPGAAWAGDKKATSAAATPFTSIDECKTGQTVYVTCDLALLKKQWEECEMGGCDDGLLESYLGCVAKIVEVEEDDDTVNLEWTTKDTQWIPIMACTKDLPAEMRRHAPGAAWAGAKTSAFVEKPFTSIEECKTGETIFVTCDLALLKKQWEEAELGAVDDDLLESYLACQGKVLEIEEDDDTVNLEWVTKDTQWMPIMACTKDLPANLRRHAPGADWSGPAACAGGGEKQDDHELIESELPVVEV